MDNIKLKDLLQKHISGTISEPERLILWMELEKPENAAEIKAVLFKLSLESREAGSYNPKEWEGMITSILNADKVYKIESPDPAETPIYEIKPGRKQLPWAAAAAILILLSAGSYLFLSRRSAKEFAATNNTITALNNDKAPGGRKAILYLANGQKINLDSARNGQLAKLGSTTVTKTDSGKLLIAAAENNISESVGLNTLQTPRGGIYQITLPDGTEAWLNAESSITYPTQFNKKQRDVSITGEVYFEVAKDAAHPFIVSLGANSSWMQVEVLGTHFNINAYEDNEDNQTKTTLLEGSVKIMAHGESRMIRPGEQALASFIKTDIEINNQVDLEKVIAWKNGEMLLTNNSVKQLMHEISRWYDVDIQYAGPIPDKKFYGSINRNVPLSTVLNGLNAYGVKTTLEGKKIIVQ